MVALSFCYLTTVCVRQSHFAELEREKGVKKSEGESDVRKDERKSLQGREEGAGMKDTADGDRCT